MAYLKEKGKLVALDKDLSSNSSHTVAYLNDKVKDMEAQL
jgi:hypothetical protein